MNMFIFRYFSSFTKKVIAGSSISLYCLVTSATLPQSHIIINISESYADSRVTSKQSIDNLQRLHFYNDGKALFFVNEYAKRNSQSYGRVSDIIKDTNIIHFKWAWQNSYDDKTGMADVYINTLKDRSCRVVIITDKMTVLDYRGECNGSMDELFAKYSSDAQKSKSANNKTPTTKQKNKTPSLKKWK